MTIFLYQRIVIWNSEKRRRISQNYDLKIVTDFKKFNQLLYQKEKEVQLVRMAAGYAWDWISKKDKSLYDIEIQGIKKQWNHCTEGWGAFQRGH